MEIRLKCSCGAEVEFKDLRGIYINPGGKADEKGLMFIIEVRAEEWQEKHQGCLMKGR